MKAAERQERARKDIMRAENDARRQIRHEQRTAVDRRETELRIASQRAARAMTKAEADPKSEAFLEAKARYEAAGEALMQHRLRRRAN